MRHADYVTSIAKSANANGYHFGALIFQGRNIVSTGWCQCKSHPRQARFMRYAKSYKRNNTYMHAEIHALVSAKCDVEGCDMIVARVSNQQLQPSFPCGACHQATRAAGIRRIWYWSGYKWIYNEGGEHYE